ncbi:Hypothetical protein LUCI_0453 [Lucifera butyrica]|uniref:DUF1294 domain-containing protein n=1 Tax=Lucifera butyrica TaxID=1351585 RepID=A0A498QYI4_9FIRM|nr:DUF1294 domain-containing protein [Lucifera butyrica]VBB05246.1 Hypothetical protein LUCI_0453 [Lucifera butyrica]
MLVGYLLWNAAVFWLMRLDKKRARQGGWRIRERTLFLCALGGGAGGAWLGMYAFRHKTRHIAFVIGMPLLWFINLVCLYFWQGR